MLLIPTTSSESMSYVECCYGACLVATSCWRTETSEARRAAGRTLAPIGSARFAEWDSSPGAGVMQSKGESSKGLFGDIDREVRAPRGHSLRAIGAWASIESGCLIDGEPLAGTNRRVHPPRTARRHSRLFPSGPWRSLPVCQRPTPAHMHHRHLLTHRSRNLPLDLNDAFLPVMRRQIILAIIRSATRAFQCSGKEKIQLECTDLGRDDEESS